MIEVTISAPFTAATLNVALDIAEAAQRSGERSGQPVAIDFAPMCGEPISTPLGPLPSCCLPIAHKGEHSPYGTTSPVNANSPFGV